MQVNLPVYTGKGIIQYLASLCSACVMTYSGSHWRIRTTHPGDGERERLIHGMEMMIAESQCGYYKCYARHHDEMIFV